MGAEEKLPNPEAGNGATPLLQQEWRGPHSHKATTIPNMTTMKPTRLFPKINFTLLSLATAFSGVLLLTGCATADLSKKQALACPECRMTEVVLENPSPGSDYTTLTASNQREHACSYCQGAIKTLFKEGSLRHHCSLCAQEMFFCPTSHRL